VPPTPPIAGIKCYSCSGTDNLCTDANDEGTSGACYTNQTLCTVARLKETANPDNQIIARGCGPQNSYVKGEVCEEFKIDGASGFLCTCDTQNCNSLTNSQVMLQRAEEGITSSGETSGVQCHVCSGEDNICSNMEDGGTVTACSAGVSTCLVGKSNDETSIARSCGIVDAEASKECSVGDLFTVCICNGSLCNSPEETSALFEIATTTEKTVTVDMASLVNIVQIQQSQAQSQTSGSSEVDVASLIATNFPSLADQDVAGKCAWLSTGEQVELTSEGIFIYSQTSKNGSSSTIARIDECVSDSGNNLKNNGKTFLIILVSLFVILV